MIWHTLSVFAQQNPNFAPSWSDLGYAAPFALAVVWLVRKLDAKDRQLVELTKAYHAQNEATLAVLNTVSNNQESALRAQLATALEEIAESHRLIREATTRRGGGGG